MKAGQVLILRVETINIRHDEDEILRKQSKLVKVFDDRPAKYDLREWDPDHQKMSKGVTLNDEEMEILSKILKDRGI